MLSLWDIGSDIALCISIYQNVGLASWMPWISILAIVCGLAMETYMTCVQIKEFKKRDKVTKEYYS